MTHKNIGQSFDEFMAEGRMTPEERATETIGKLCRSLAPIWNLDDVGKEMLCKILDEAFNAQDRDSREDERSKDCPCFERPNYCDKYAEDVMFSPDGETPKGGEG